MDQAVTKNPAHGWVFMNFLPHERWFRGLDI